MVRELRNMHKGLLQRIFWVLMSFIVYMVLIFSYRHFIFPVFEYSGFFWSFNEVKLIEGFLLIFIVAFLLPVSFRKPSDILLHLLFLFPILPMIVLFVVQDRSRLFLYIGFTAFLFIYIICYRFRIKPIRLSISLSINCYQAMLLLIGWSVIGTIIAFGGLKFFNLNLLKVYGYRADAALNLPVFFGYVSPAVSKVVFPFALLLAIVQRNRLNILAALSGSVMMFGLTSHKGPLFYPAVVAMLFWLLNRKKTISFLYIGYFGLVACSIAVFFLFENILVGSFLLRRSFFVPAYLNYLYFDFFFEHPFVYWARSKITFRLLDYPYPLDVPHLIGYYFFNRPEMGANTGWLGSGYANAGFAGIFIYAFLISLLLLFLDSYGKIINKRIITAIMIIPMLSIFMSSDLFTALLTHGALMGCLLLPLLPASLNRT